jgi:hypothetical protein
MVWVSSSDLFFYRIAYSSPLFWCPPAQNFSCLFYPLHNQFFCSTEPLDLEAPRCLAATQPPQCSKRRTGLCTWKCFLFPSIQLFFYYTIDEQVGPFIILGYPF